MNSETIKEFLVSLGFKTDEVSEKKFANAIAFATERVKLLVDAVEKLAENTYGSISKFVDNMEGLYYASQRTNSSVENIEALQFAADHLGSSGQEALSSLEGIARFMRETPGSEGFIGSLGVATRDANGAMRDTSEVLVDIGKRLSSMDYAHANVYAGMLGIDEKTLIALRSGEFEAQFKKHKKLAEGVNFQKAAKDAREFKNTLRDVGTQFHVMAARGEIAMLSRLLPALQRFSNWLQSEPVQQFLDKMISAVEGVLGEIGDVLTDVGGAIMDAISSIDFGNVEDLADAFKDVWQQVKLMGAAIAETFGPVFKATIQGAVDLVQLLVQGLAAFADLASGDNDKLARRGEKIAAIAGHVGTDVMNIGNGFLGRDAAPRGGTTASVQQKTDIHVYDAGGPGVGQTIANEQDRVNSRMVRNLKGAVQ